MFVWVVLLIAYGHRDPYAHFMTQNMENTFVGHQESLGPREEDKINTRKPSGNDDVMKLYDVSSKDAKLVFRFNFREDCNCMFSIWGSFY